MGTRGNGNFLLMSGVKDSSSLHTVCFFSTEDLLVYKAFDDYSNCDDYDNQVFAQITLDRFTKGYFKNFQIVLNLGKWFHNAY